MAKPEEKIFKKGYTEFDERLDQELQEEKDALRRELLLQAPDYKLLNWMAENDTETAEMSAKLKAACYYFLRSEAEDETEKFVAVWYKMLRAQPSLREDILKQAGFLGCLAFKKNMPELGRCCAETILEDLYLLGNETPELTEEGYLLFKNVTDTSIRSHYEAAFNKIVKALYGYWSQNSVVVTPGLLSVLTDLLFVTADRRQIDSLNLICRVSRSVLLHNSTDAVMRQRFVLEWSGIAAQIAQRGWEKECGLLLKHLCLCLGSVRDTGLIKKAMADVSVHMQMQSKWDNFETAFRLYYPCQLFALVMLQWSMRRYRHVLQAEQVMEVEAAIQDSGIIGQVERKLELLDEKEKALDMLRFVLRNARDMAAACARLLMKDEWEIYTAWQKEWMFAALGKEKRRKRIRHFLQMVVEYWRSTQPSRSNKQWDFMKEVTSPLLLSDKHRELIKTVS